MGQHGQSYDEAWDMMEDIILGDLELPLLWLADMKRLMETISLCRCLRAVASAMPRQVSSIVIPRAGSRHRCTRRLTAVNPPPL